MLAKSAMADPRDFINFDEIVNVGPVAIKAAVQKGSRPREYFIEGSASFTADLMCARCLEPYPFASSSTFHLRFQPRPEVPRQDEEIEIAPDELDVEFYTDRQIPLRDLALEQIQLSMPMKPLCREDCLGLCPTCGTNRNREACACVESVADERLGALREIRQAIKKRES